MNHVGAKYVCNIRGLLITNADDCNAIAQKVDEYVEAIPTLTDKMKASLKRSNIPEFKDALKIVISLCESVRSKYLLNDAKTILTFASNGNVGMCQKKLPPLIAKLLSLSIEMQAAKNSGPGDKDIEVSAVEFYNDILNNLFAAFDLAHQKNYGDAIDIISIMSVLDNNKTAIALINALRSRKETVDLFTNIIDEYKQKIETELAAQAKSNWSILLVDDRPEILDVVTGFLKDRYKVFALTGGNLALDFLAKKKPDLFILDIDMPEMDGITLTRHIRSIPDLAKTPIIILTSNAKKEYVHAAVQAGANDFLAKPPNKDLILAKVFTHLSARKRNAA